MAERVYLAANNPDLGGGEQMVLRHAEALLDLGRDVSVVAADSPTEVLDAAAELGARPVAIRADGRRDYIARLRTWDRHERDGLLWAHGLVPALATAGHRDRIVHLHQDPRGSGQRAAARIARSGALAVLVPSSDMAARTGARAHPNWTEEIIRVPRPAPAGTVGYLGRLTTDKGVDLLCEAVRASEGVRLVLAGDTRHVPTSHRIPVEQAISAMDGRASVLGHVARSELFDRCDLVAFPSRWSEPFGLVIAEAMAAGVPFVVSDAGAMPEVAGPDHPWVARAGDLDDLVRVLGLALSADADAVRAVTDRARRRWEAEYSPQAGRERVRRLLEELDR